MSPALIEEGSGRGEADELNFVDDVAGFGGEGISPGLLDGPHACGIYGFDPGDGIDMAVGGDFDAFGKEDAPVIGPEDGAVVDGFCGVDGVGDEVDVGLGRAPTVPRQGRPVGQVEERVVGPEGEAQLGPQGIAQALGNSFRAEVGDGAEASFARVILKELGAASVESPETGGCRIPGDGAPVAPEVVRDGFELEIGLGRSEDGFERKGGEAQGALLGGIKFPDAAPVGGAIEASIGRHGELAADEFPVLGVVPPFPPGLGGSVLLEIAGPDFVGEEQARGPGQAVEALTLGIHGHGDDSLIFEGDLGQAFELSALQVVTHEMSPRVGIPAIIRDEVGEGAFVGAGVGGEVEGALRFEEGRVHFSMGDHPVDVFPQDVIHLSDLLDLLRFGIEAVEASGNLLMVGVDGEVEVAVGGGSQAVVIGIPFEESRVKELGGNGGGGGERQVPE